MGGRVPSAGSRAAAVTGRPRWLGGLIVLALLTTFLAAASGVSSAGALTVGPNPVVLENQQLGTAAWQLDASVADDVRQQVKGYASDTSVNVGSPITFYVSVSPAQSVSLDVYRLGYYQGLGGRLMQHVGNLSGVTQPTCPSDPTTGMISCGWSATYSLNVPATWVSGIYEVKLTNARGFENRFTFVVRDDARQAALLYQQSVTTYQAYNNYPNDASAGASVPATGKSLYDYNSSLTRTGLGTSRAVKVSFDRPYADDGGGQYFEFENYYVRWLEQNGYDVAYSTDVDTDLSGTRLLNYSGFLSVGHDEYWTKAMFDNVAAARDGGINVGFFGGNSVYWQARFAPSASGKTDRVLICYKDATLDPVKDATTTMRWRDPQVNRPEQQLIGLTGVGQQPDGVPPASYVATNSSSWVYAGTGVSNNDPIAKIVGYETDRYVSGYKAPTAAAGTYTTLSSSPYLTTSGTQEYQQSSVYQAPSGSWVFAAGTIEWSWGLYNDDGASYADPRIQQMTANVLNRFIAGAQPLPAAPTNLTADPSPGAVNLGWTDNASDETAYVLDRSTSPSFEVITTFTLPANATGYADTGLAAGTYYYRLRATNNNGNSPFVLAAAATTSYSQLVDSRSDLRDHWRLGESSGTTAWDTTGSANGSYASGTQLAVTGAIARDTDTAVAFNGTSTAKVTLPTQAAATNFTIEGWSFLTATSPMNNTVYGGSSSVRLLARPGAPGSPTTAYAGVWLGGVEYVLQPSTSDSNLNQWVHWAMTRDGSALSLYRNGILVGQRLDLPATTPADLSGNIGTQSNGGAYPLTGRIDEVALYTGARTVGDITDDYTAGINGLTPLPSTSLARSYRDTVLGESSLTSYWRLGEASGTVATDSKGTANGAYVNGVTLGAPGAIANDPDRGAGFSGTTQRVTLPALPAVGDFSIEGWTYLTNPASTNNALYGANLNARILARPGTGSTPTAAYAGVWLNGVEYALQPNSTASNVNTWVHWVLTRHGSTLTLYRDAAQIAQRTDLPATATANVSGSIGAQNSSSYFLAGSIDDVAVYNSALSASAVSIHYRAALSGPAPQ